MAIFELDIAVDKPEETDAYSQEMELDGIVYTFRFLWNRRDESFVLNVYLPDGTLLAANRKVVLGFPLLRGEIDIRLPPGILIVFDSTIADEEPTRTQLGRRFYMTYLDADEVAA